MAMILVKDKDYGHFHVQTHSKKPLKSDVKIGGNGLRQME